MFPLKNFVQGPSLHDEVVSYEDETKSHIHQKQGSLTGEEVSKFYEEVINLPSTASSSSTTGISKNPSLDYSVETTSSTVLKDNEKVPKLTQLMSFCEANDYKSLRKAFDKFRSVIDVNAVDEFGWTLLMSASCAGAINCVSVLLQLGASWAIRDKKGLTALNLAEKNRHSKIVDFLQEWNFCYEEQLERMKNQNTETEKCLPGSATTGSSFEDRADSSSNYCSACRINFRSAKEVHENSIAHLVCSAQFGNDKTHFGIPESNKGFQLLIKGGWDKSSGLGPEGRGHKFPVKTVLKRNKLGLGNEKERKAARITHFAPFDSAAVENPERKERQETIRRREAIKTRSRDKRKEINFRREFSSL